MDSIMASTVSYAGQSNKWNTAEDAAPVAEKIRSTKEVKCLNLEANTLGVEAARVIGDALALHPEFERASWKDLFTGRLKTEIPEALKHLFSGIRRAKAKLLALDLSDNALGPIGVAGMIDFIKSESCYSLQELRLNNNGLGIKGGTMLAEALIELAKSAESAGSPLNLKVFIVGRNRLENPGAKIFSKFFSQIRTLEEIEMPQNGIQHQGIGFLARSFSLNPNLKTINLNDNTFTPKGAKSMAEELPKISNLEVINFGDCLLKTNGAFAIACALQTHTHLKELYMDGNEIQFDGGVAIVQAVIYKEHISHLMLDCNQFGEEAEQLKELLKQVNKENILGSLDDNEEPDYEEEDYGESEDEEGSDKDEDEEGTDKEDEDEEEVDEEEEGISPLKRETFVHFQYPFKCTPAEFLEAPTAARLLGISGAVVSIFVEEAKRRAENPDRDPDFGSPRSPEALVNECIRIFMSIASFSIGTNKNIGDIVEEVTKGLMKEAFEVATENQILPYLTNSILVHFGLMKSESKSFKIVWNIRGGLIALEKQISKPFFSTETKNMLKVIFSSPNLAVDSFIQEKNALISALA